MKFTLLTLMLSTFLFVKQTKASHDLPGEKEALAVCNQFLFPDDILKCFESVKNKKFDPKGIALCNNGFNNNEIVSCMLQIENLQFTDEDISLCSSFIWPEAKAECLVKVGSKMPNNEWPITKEALILELEKVILQINDDEPIAARRALYKLINTLERN
jgi:hypothetical protein